MRDSIQTLLTGYAQALRNGDQAALRRLVAPDRLQFLDGQLRLQSDLTALHTDVFDYRLTADVPADPVAQQQQWRLDSAVSYAVTGVDVDPVQRPFTVGVVRDGSTWLVFDAGPAAVPWQFGELTEQRSDHAGRAAVVVGHPGSPLTPRLAAEIGPALQSLEAFWGDGWRAGILLLATASDAEFRALVGGSRMDGVAAASVADRVADGVVVGQRLVFAPGSAALPSDQLRVVLRHELFHAATRAVTADSAPLWLVEGVADYNGRRGSDVSLPTAAPLLTAALRRGEQPDHLPTDADLQGAEDVRTQAYERAWSLTQCIADTFGEAKLKALYLDAVAPSAAPVPVVINRVLGIDEPALVQMWRRWLSGRQIR